MSKESNTQRGTDRAAEAEAFVTIVELSTELRCCSNLKHAVPGIGMGRTIRVLSAAIEERKSEGTSYAEN